MKILNLYAGLGGNRKYWEGEVTAVEKNEKIAAVYQSFYPNDKVIVGDAHKYLLDHYAEYDFISSGPPCQTHSKMNMATRHNMVRYVDGRLFEEIIFLKTYFKGHWVVENVVPYYEPIWNPARIGRHLFWSNFYISQMIDPPKSPRGMMNLATVGQKEIMMAWLGLKFDENIYYEGNHCPVQVLRNCVHPLVGGHIMNCLKGQTADLFNKEIDHKILTPC